MNLKWRLSHARGYLALGLVEEAAAELRGLSAEDEERIDTLGLRVALLQTQQKWKPLRAAAKKLVVLQPEETAWWITWAYATRRAVSLAAAEKILHDAAHLHPKEPTIQFNLGCYACQRGDLPTARQRIAHAIALDDSFHELAEHDPDLAPLRAEPA